jgi:hypothetical protein
MACSQFTKYYMCIRQNGVDVHLYDDISLVGSIYFKPEGRALQPARLDASGRIILQYSLNLLEATMQMLRYEKPLYVWYSDPGIAYIGTFGQEPVGEQEGV